MSESAFRYLDAAKVCCKLSRSFLKQDNLDKAKRYAQDAISVCPEWYDGYLSMAKIYEYELDRHQAMKYYDMMIDIANKNNTEISNYERNEKENVDINIMRAWLIKNGAIINSTKIEYYDVDYRGMISDNNIRPSEIIMSIPYKCIISEKESRSMKYNTIISKKNEIHDIKHNILAIALLNIRADISNEYNYYVNCLPKHFSNVPINFSPEVLQNLEGSFALYKTALKLLFLHRDYNTILSLIPEFEYSFEDFVWARTCVITRIYAGKILNPNRSSGEEERDSMLVPFADMANHDNKPNTLWMFDDNTNSFVVRCVKNIADGDTIYESYGKKSNYRYFVNYGFTIENNPNEEVCISRNMLVNSLTSWDNFKDYKLYESVLPNLSDFISVGYNVKSDNYKLLCDLMSEPKQDILVTYQNIINLMNMYLSRYHSTYEEDKQTMKIIQLNFNARNCFIMCMSEKKLFNYIKNYFTDMSQLELLNQKINKNNSCKQKYMKEKKKLEKSIKKTYIHE